MGMYLLIGVLTILTALSLAFMLLFYLRSERLMDKSALQNP